MSTFPARVVLLAVPEISVHSNAGRSLEFVARPDPPPPTTSRGILAHLGAWRRE